MHLLNFPSADSRLLCANFFSIFHQREKKKFIRFLIAVSTVFVIQLQFWKPLEDVKVLRVLDHRTVRHILLHTMSVERASLDPVQSLFKLQEREQLEWHLNFVAMILQVSRKEV